MFDELKEIFINRKVDEIVPFLKKLTPKDKKEIQPRLEKLLELQNFRHRDNPVFYAAALVCCNKTQYKNLTRWVNDGGIEIYNEILDWYNPGWFSEYVNEQYDGQPFMPYHLLVEWEQKGYIILQPEKIAHLLAYKLTDLDKYPITLKEHIWHLFEYETNLYWSNVYQNRAHSGSLAYLTETGLIDRNRILKECLLTANRNFNKNLSGWFADLFIELKPTPEELLSIQPELFSVLHSIQSKPLNNALNHIKTIAGSDIFDANEFISHIPILVTSTVKATIKGAIDIAEKMLKAREELRTTICLALCDGFISKDETIQKKLAKLLAKYGDKETLKEPLAAYSTHILKSVEPLLAGLYDAIPVNEQQTSTIEEVEALLPLIREDNEIKPITTFDDYIFFLNQAFENNQVHNILFIPVYIQQYHKQITAEKLYMLEPVVKKAIQTSTTWSDHTGLIVKFYASFFLHYMAYLAEIYPDVSGNIRQLLDKHNDKFVSWKSKYMYPETYPYYYMMLKVYDCIKKEETFDLLSIPTHAPCWIDPLTLVQRLIDSAGSCKTTKEIEPFSYDLQYALQQCGALDNTGEALKLAKKELTGELQELMIFLLDKDTVAPKEVGHPAWWMTASITKYPGTIPPYTNEWGFADIPKEYLTGDFSWEIKTDDYGDPVMQLTLPPYHVKDPEKSMVAQYMFSRFRGRTILNGDITLLMYTYPYSHDTINGHILLHINTIIDISHYVTMRNNALMALLDLHLPLSKMDCLLIGHSMLAADKTNRNMAAEVWLNAIKQQHISNRQVGKDIGKMLNGKLSPAKRLTDLIENNLLTGNPLVNQSLETLLTSILSEIKTPITNLKKLLEIYSELLALNNSKADMEAIPQLPDWAKENSLKKIVKQILNNANQELKESSNPKPLKGLLGKSIKWKG